MGHWEQKMADALRPYLNGHYGLPRREELRKWLSERNLVNISTITDPSHVVELMEMIDRWHDEDVAKQPCAAPAPPANPFIIERVYREIKRGTTANITVKTISHHGVSIGFNPRTYTPSQMRNLAKQLTDLADAHEAIYPPTENACAAAC